MCSQPLSVSLDLPLVMLAQPTRWNRTIDTRLRHRSRRSPRPDPNRDSPFRLPLHLVSRNARPEVFVALRPALLRKDTSPCSAFTQVDSRASEDSATANAASPLTPPPHAALPGRTPESAAHTPPSPHTAARRQSGPPPPPPRCTRQPPARCRRRSGRSTT